MLSGNPLWFREQRAWEAHRLKLPRWRRARFLALPALWLGTMGLTLAVALVMDQHSRVIEVLGAGAAVAMYLQLAYLAFRSVIAGAAGLTRERELQTIDTLMSSPLPVSQLLLGKWMVAALPILAEVGLVMPLALLGTLHEPNRDGFSAWQVADFGCLSVGLTMAMTALGVLLSTRAVNTGRAATQAVLAGLGLTLGTYVVDLLVEMFTRQESLQPILCWFNPYTAMWAIMTGGEARESWSQHHSHIAPTFWVATTALYLIGTALAFAFAHHRLQRRAA